LALLATAYEQPVKLYFLTKLRRACELWDEGEKALAHIHLAHAGLPRCSPDRDLRLFVADELIEAGVTPETLMQAQGFDPPPLALLKANFNPAQPRWPAGRGRDSGEWSGGDATITPVAFRNRRESGRHGRRGGFDALHGFLEWLRGRSQEKAESAVKPFGSLESDLPRPGFGEEVSIPGLPDDIKAIDTTKTDLTRSEFESELSQLGWTKEPSDDGKAMNYFEAGAKYSVRDNAKSTWEPTADFYHPRGDGESIDMKLRLRKD
jgi:hypothetical protein